VDIIRPKEDITHPKEDIRGHWVGPLLWPAVAAHAVLTVLLARAGHKAHKVSTSSSQRDGQE